MRLIVNITPLLSPLTGIGHYTHQLVDKLQTADVVEDIRGVSPLRWYDHTQLVELLQPQAETKTNDPAVGKKRPNSQLLMNVAKKVPYARKVRQMLQQRTVRKQANHFTNYLYWEPNYTLLPIENPAINTVHDLSHIHYPQFHPAERVKLLDQQLEASLHRAERLIAVSEYTRQDMMDQFGLSADKIDIVSPAVSDSFRCEFTPSEIAEVKNVYGLPHQFILSVATLEPRKNIEGLIKAFSTLPSKTRKTYPLVLVGARGWLNASLEKLLEPMLARNEVLRLGYVDQSHLPIIYAAATVTAYVSFFEGFGMPVAESMAAGTPVITSNNSSMPEVANGAALLVEPENTESIREALANVLSDEDLQQSMIQRGRLSSSGYTWSASADNLLSALSTLDNQATFS